MYKKPGGRTFGVLLFLVLIGVVLLITRLQEHRSTAKIAAHPGWAVAYFEKFTYSHKTGYAQYRFQWNRNTYHSLAQKDWVIDLGSVRKTTCFPVVFDTTDMENNEVIIRSEQLDDLHLAIPDSIALRVAQATHDLKVP